nr:hypothetical protein [Morchella crassipes]
MQALAGHLFFIKLLPSPAPPPNLTHIVFHYVGEEIGGFSPPPPPPPTFTHSPPLATRPASGFLRAPLMGFQPKRGVEETYFFFRRKKNPEQPILSFPTKAPTQPIQLRQ